MTTNNHSQISYRRISRSLRSFVLLLTSLWAIAPHSVIAGSEPVPQEAIVRLEDGVLVADVLATYNATLEATIALGSRPKYLFGLPEGITETQFLSLAQEDERIKDARLNFTAAAPDPSTQSFFFPVASILRPSQANRPGIFLTTPEPRTNLGEGIIVAVIDTGVDPSLAGFGDGTVLEGVSFVPNTGSSADVGDGVDSDGDGDTDELVGHGTFVASIIQLVAPEAQILPIRVLDSDGKGNMFRVAQGIEAAVTAGAKVINVSLGSTANVDVVNDVIEEANLLGITVIAAVGNEGSQLVVYPAANPGVIAVASLNGDLSPAAFTNYGVHTSIAAVGTELVGATPDGSNLSSGTSFSAALVSGAAAAILSVDPTLQPSEVKTRLASTATPIADPKGTYDGLLGAGALDIQGALSTVGANGPYLYGDLNLDGSVNLADLNLILTVFGQEGPIADADGNGLVDLDDLNTVLSRFGMKF